MELAFALTRSKIKSKTKNDQAVASADQIRKDMEKKREEDVKKEEERKKLEEEERRRKEAERKRKERERKRKEAEADKRKNADTNKKAPSVVAKKSTSTVIRPRKRPLVQAGASTSATTATTTIRRTSQTSNSAESSTKGEKEGENVNRLRPLDRKEMIVYNRWKQDIPPMESQLKRRQDEHNKAKKEIKSLTKNKKKDTEEYANTIEKKKRLEREMQHVEEMIKLNKEKIEMYDKRQREIDRHRHEEAERIRKGRKALGKERVDVNKKINNEIKVIDTTVAECERMKEIQHGENETIETLQSEIAELNRRVCEREKDLTESQGREKDATKKMAKLLNKTDEHTARVEEYNARLTKIAEEQKEWDRREEVNNTKWGFKEEARLEMTDQLHHSVEVSSVNSDECRVINDQAQAPCVIMSSASITQDEFNAGDQQAIVTSTSKGVDGNNNEANTSTASSYTARKSTSKGSKNRAIVGQETMDVSSSTTKTKSKTGTSKSKKEKEKIDSLRQNAKSKRKNRDRKESEHFSNLHFTPEKVYEELTRKDAVLVDKVPEERTNQITETYLTQRKRLGTTGATSLKDECPYPSSKTPGSQMGKEHHNRQHYVRQPDGFMQVNAQLNKEKNEYKYFERKGDKREINAGENAVTLCHTTRTSKDNRMRIRHSFRDPAKIGERVPGDDRVLTEVHKLNPDGSTVAPADLNYHIKK